MSGFILIVVFSTFQNKGSVGGYTADISFSGNATNTSVSVGASLNIATSTVLSANSDRQYARITNIGATSTDICLHSTACTFGTGIRLEPYTNATTSGGFFEITRDNLYTGAIIGVVSATSSTSTLQTVER